jgi:hypothetical protein
MPGRRPPDVPADVVISYNLPAGGEKFYGGTYGSAGSVHLGRPWHPGGDVRAVAQVVIRDSVLGAAIADPPWTEMNGFPWQEARFAEYRNTGPGSTRRGPAPSPARRTCPAGSPGVTVSGD